VAFMERMGNGPARLHDHFHKRRLRPQRLFELDTEPARTNAFAHVAGDVRWESSAGKLMSSGAYNRIRQCEGHLDLSLYLDGNSVDRGRAEAPLPDGFESGFGEPWVTCPG
jgi:hypothetical protein